MSTARGAATTASQQQENLPLDTAPGRCRQPFAAGSGGALQALGFTSLWVDSSGPVSESKSCER